MGATSFTCCHPRAQEAQGGESLHLGADLAAERLGIGVGIATLLRGSAHHAARGRLYVPEELLRRHGALARTLLRGPDPPDLWDYEAAVAPEAEARAGYSAEEVEARRKRRVSSRHLSEAERAAARASVAALAVAAERHLDAAEALCMRGELPADMQHDQGQGGGGAGGDGRELAAAVAAAGPVPSALLPAFWPAVRAREYLEALRSVGFDLHHPNLWPLPEHERHRPLKFQLRLLAARAGLRSPFKR